MLLEYRAGEGERNRVRVTAGDGFVRIADRAGLTAGRGCELDGPSDGTAATCAVGETSSADVGLRLGDRDDRATVGAGANGEAVLRGGSGNDRLRSFRRTMSRFVGGSGDDIMRSGSVFRAVFDEGSRPNGSDTMSVAAGPVPAYGWQIGHEAWVDYGARRGRVFADLDAQRDDGERGERDRLGAGLTGIRGGHADDRLTGDAAHNQLIGGAGSDLLDGRGGDDAMAATAGRRTSTGQGVLGAGRDRILGGRGQDLIEGSAGRNTLVPGPGPDVVWGAGGADRVRARDGFVDELHCGNGRDGARADPIDAVRDCERSSARHLGAVPTELDGEHWDCKPHQTQCGHPWHAYVRVACARERVAGCKGVVTLELDGSPAGEAAFEDDGSAAYVDIEISWEVLVLLEEWDRRLSVRVRSGGQQVTVNAARLPGHELSLPSVP